LTLDAQLQLEVIVLDIAFTRFVVSGIETLRRMIAR